ncbi:hypothetical protein BC629DRAFT_1277071 [Irpex lacteus]|nr:hypothetical protein BC629DRAFT_1277071 [Irpex lacteus]
MAPQERYHVFSIPPTLLDTLVPRTILTQASQDESTRPPSPPPPPAPTQNGAARACNICLGAAFADVDEQRAHFRSDWHRYNVKMRVAGSNAVSEAQFGQLVDGLEDSISGSATTSESETDDSDDAVHTLVQKAKRLKAREDSSSPDDPSSSSKIPNAPVVWFHSPPTNTQIGVYKSIFPSPLASSSSSSGQEFLDELKAMQGGGGGENGRKWALFMTAGGHFAGAIVRVSKPDGEDYEEPGTTKRGKQKKPKPDTEVLLHKTFHRYTTRRKQGGSQSLNDNSKSKAVSAGAMLRRYGEQALRDDIRNLLNDWAEELEDCERIFIRASVSNRKIFLGYEGAPLHKDDTRLRTFPFPTRRPTQSELLRCLLELTQVKVSHLTEDALRAQDEAFLASLPKPKPKPLPSSVSSAQAGPGDEKKEKVVLTPEELARQKAESELRSRWERAIEMVERGRVDALKAFLSKGDPLGGGGVDARMPDGIADGVPGMTLLMVATRKGREEVLRWLLEEERADPTIAIVRTAGTAYDFATTKNARNVFRRCAADHPEWWDWLGEGRVPSVLSKEMEEGREEKKKARRKGLKEKIREREAQKEREVVVEEPKPRPVEKVKVKERDDGPRKLGGSNTAQESVMGLTPEMRARIERERRARAAEVRLGLKK